VAGVSGGSFLEAGRGAIFRYMEFFIRRNGRGAMCWRALLALVAAQITLVNLAAGNFDIGGTGGDGACIECVGSEAPWQRRSLKRNRRGGSDCVSRTYFLRAQPHRLMTRHSRFRMSNLRLIPEPVSGNSIPESGPRARLAPAALAKKSFDTKRVVHRQRVGR